VSSYGRRRAGRNDGLKIKMRDGFHQMGIPLDLVEDILPDYHTNELKYVLSSADHHPNALADRLLAQYIFSRIVQ
jgi:hypothetical protein